MGETDDFEWDDGKDAANRAKHGLPLLFAEFIFDGRVRLERPSPKVAHGEPRLEAMADVMGRVIIMCLHLERASAAPYIRETGTPERETCLRTSHRRKLNVCCASSTGRRSTG
ncbi:BrnT family toxin [Ancylobacter moscoviensis]